MTVRLVVALALASLCVAAAPAAAAPGDLAFGGCISGDMDATEEFGGQGCEAVPNPSAEGLFSAFDLIQQVAVSPDGRHVYAVSSSEDAIVALRRDSEGTLNFVNCVTGDTGIAPCAAAPKATAGGSTSGLNAVYDVVVSPDGRHLYATAPSDSAVAILGRDSATGEIAFGGCVTGDTDTGPSGSGACGTTPVTGPSGADSGLAGARYLAISDDGSNVYAAGVNDTALAAFDRNAGNGALAFNSCATGRSGALIAEGGGCFYSIPGQDAGGSHTALTDTHSVAVAPGGDYVYTTSEDGALAAAFDRAPGGEASFDSCVTGAQGEIAATGGCAQTPYTSSNGVTSGLGRLQDIAASPDGRDVYAVSPTDDSVVTFRHDPDTAELSFVRCVTADNGASTLIGRNCAPLPGSSATGEGSGLFGLAALAISADGRRLYTGAGLDDSVAVFARNRGSGTLSLRRCLSGDTETTRCVPVPNGTAEGATSGLDGVNSIAFDPVRGAVYTAAYGDDAVAWFGPEPEPVSSDAAPAPAPAPPPLAAPPDTVVPVLWGLRLTPRIFALSGRARAKGGARSSARGRGRRRVRRLKRSTLVRYKLSEPGAVQVGVQRGLPGRRKAVRGKRRCVKPTRGLVRRKAKRCLRFRALKPPLTRPGTAGPNSFRFAGRLGRRTLSPGRYRLLLRATDAAGNSSALRRRVFRIVRATAPR